MPPGSAEYMFIGETTTRFATAEYLDTPERQAAYITAAFETGDPAFMRDAIGVVARARGMAEIAKAAVKWGKTSWVGRLSFA